MDDFKRMHEAVRKSPEFLKARQTLIWGSLGCVTLLALIGVLVMNDRLTLPYAIGGLAFCSVAYFYFITRFFKTRSLLQTHWAHAEAMKKQKKQTRKQERKKNR